MPDALKYQIDEGYADGQTSLTKFTYASIEIKAAGVDIGNQNWSAANAHLQNAGTYLGDAASYLLTHATYATSLTQHWKNALYWINDNWPEGAAVDMDAILSAMLTASFTQLQKFIGITEAYQIALWNAPFNADLFAALGRGFATWPGY